MKKTHYIMILCMAVFAAVFFIGIKASKGQKELPKVVSKIKSIEVVSVSLKNVGPLTLVAVEIRNNSYKPIIAVTLESRSETEASGTNLNGFRKGDEPPRIVLNPFESTVMEMPVNDIKPGAGLQIGAVMYADGTEEGDERTLDTMRGQKEHHKNDKKKEPSVKP